MFFRRALVLLALAACARTHATLPDSIVSAAHPLLEKPAPPIAAPSIGGAKLDTRSMVGSVVVVHFWATWSEGSRQMLPKLAALYAKYKGRGLEVVALSIDDDPARVSELAREVGVDFPLAWDDHKEIVRHWLVDKLPASFVVDRRGVVRAAFLGYEDGLEVEIESDIRLLAGDDLSVKANDQVGE
jgi:peroxiredoxin